LKNIKLIKQIVFIGSFLGALGVAYMLPVNYEPTDEYRKYRLVEYNHPMSWEMFRDGRQFADRQFRMLLVVLLATPFMPYLFWGGK